MVLVLLVLASAFLHALWNALLQRRRDKDLAGAAVVAIAAAIALAVAIGVVLVTGAEPFPSALGIFWAAAAGVFEGAYFISLVLALERSSLGLVYTVSRGGAILAVWPVSVLFLGETISALSVGGTILLGAGLVAASLDRERLASRRAGLLWSAIAAASIAGYHLCYKVSLDHDAQPTAVFAIAMVVAVSLNVLQIGAARRRALIATLRAAPAPLVVKGAICAASFLVFLVALREGGAGFVYTLRNTSVVFAVVLGWLAGQTPGVPQMAGAGLVASGALLLGASG